MVNSLRNRHGKGMIGCLLPIVLLVAFIYVGVLFGRPWFAYQQYRDEMKTVVGMHQTHSDTAMRNRITARADSLRLPAAAKNLTFRRLPDPPRLEVSAEYQQVVKVPLLGPKTLTFKPVATEPL